MLSMFKRDTPEQEQGEQVEDLAAEQGEQVEDLAAEQGEQVEDLAAEQGEQVEDLAAEQGEQVEDLAAEQGEQVEDLAATLDATRRRLFKQLVAADGRVRDPETIDYAPELVDDPAALAARITAELEARPGIGRNSAGGDIGAGITGDPGPADLIDAIRAAHNHNR